MYRRIMTIVYLTTVIPSLKWGDDDHHHLNHHRQRLWPSGQLRRPTQKADVSIALYDDQHFCPLYVWHHLLCIWSGTILSVYHMLVFLLLLWPPLWSSGQSFWLQIQRSRVRSPGLPDFPSSSGSGTGSTQPREVKLRSYLNKKVAAPGSENRD